MVLAMGLMLALLGGASPPRCCCCEWWSCGVERELSMVTMLFPPPLPWGWSERRGTEGDPHPPPPPALPPPVKLATLCPPLAIPANEEPACRPSPLMEEKKKSTSAALSSVTTTDCDNREISLYIQTEPTYGCKLTGCLLVPLRSWLTAVEFLLSLRGLNMAEIPDSSGLDKRRLGSLFILAGFLPPTKSVPESVPSCWANASFCRVYLFVGLVSLRLPSLYAPFPCLAIYMCSQELQIIKLES